MAYPTTFLTLQNEILKELRLEEGDRDSVKDWINRAYARAALETEALQVAGTTPLTAGTSSYTLGSPIARVKVLRLTAAAGSTPGPPLDAVTLATIMALQAGIAIANTGDTPAMFAVVGEDQIELYPTPSAADIAFFWYVRSPAVLTNNGDPLELQEPYATDLCKFGACMEAAPLTKGQVDMDYRTLYEDAVRRYRVHLNRRQGTGPEQFMLPGRPIVPVPNDADRG